MAKQFASGSFHPDLRVDAALWVTALWDKGLYPFGPPFVYALDGKRFLSFPLLFPAATAPFLAAFGEPFGLLVIPVLSVIASLLLGRRLLVRAGVGPGISALTLAALVFATPLTLYAAMYWEHAPAVALSIAGIALGSATRGRALASGVAFGLAGWLRPECFVFGISLLAVEAIARRPWLLPGIGLAGIIILNLGANTYLHKTPLGLHALQVVGPDPIWRPPFWRLAANLLGLVALFAPHSILGLAGLATARTSSSGGKAAQLAAAAVLTCLLVPFIVPNSGGTQWGPRYLLVPIVVLTLAGGLAIHTVHEEQPGRPVLQRALRWVTPALLMLGVVGNMGVGVPDLVEHYAQRQDTMEQLRADPRQVIAASYHYIPLELVPLLGEKAIFTVLDADGFQALADGLSRRGVRDFLFLSYSDGQEGPSRRVSDLGDMVVECMRAGPVGPEWVAWDCTLTQAGAAR